MATIVKGITRLTRDTTANWNRYPKFIPLAGEVIVYSDRSSYEQDGNIVYVPGIKIGDGHAYLIDLPFVGGSDVTPLLTRLDDHEQNSLVHVSSADREKWDNKLNYSVIGDALIFNTD